jgi:hypothetical protein
LKFGVDERRPHTVFALLYHGFGQTDDVNCASTIVGFKGYLSLGDKPLSPEFRVKLLNHKEIITTIT